jgi:hypothetical protein
MKVFSALCLALICSAPAFAADDLLVSRALEDVRLAKQQILAGGDSRTALAAIARAEWGLMRALGQQPQPMPIPAPQPVPPPYPTPAQGYSCMASCSRSDRVTPNMLYAKLGTGTFEAEARQNAIETVRRSYNCNHSIVVTECSPQIGYGEVDAAFTCARSSGAANQLYVKGGRGQNVTEARANAIDEVRRAYTCSNDIVEVMVTDQMVPTYCTAACATSSGEPNNLYSKGASGRSYVDALVNAITSVRQAYSCSNDIVISGCSHN